MQVFILDFCDVHLNNPCHNQDNQTAKWHWRQGSLLIPSNVLDLLQQHQQIFVGYSAGQTKIKRNRFWKNLFKIFEKNPSMKFFLFFSSFENFLWKTCCNNTKRHSLNIRTNKNRKKSSVTLIYQFLQIHMTWVCLDRTASYKNKMRLYKNCHWLTKQVWNPLNYKTNDAWKTAFIAASWSTKIGWQANSVPGSRKNFEKFLNTSTVLVTGSWATVLLQTWCDYVFRATVLRQNWCLSS